MKCYFFVVVMANLRELLVHSSLTCKQSTPVYCKDNMNVGSTHALEVYI